MFSSVAVIVPKERRTVQTQSTVYTPIDFTHTSLRMGLEQLKRSLDEKMNSKSYSQAGILKQNKKPLMERFRRRKINNYLEELKYLVLSALNKEVSLYSKMEKADILDMAVRYIKATRTNSEVPTTSYRPEHEHSTTLARSYGPLQPQTENIIYDNLCQPSREIMQPHYMKENRLRVENDKNLNVKITCEDVEAKEQFPSKENNTTSARNEQNINCETTRTNAVINTTIWRPW